MYRVYHRQTILVTRHHFLSLQPDFAHMKLTADAIQTLITKSIELLTLTYLQPG